MIFGIDVGADQGNIDWKKVKNDGVKYAILRCIRRNRADEQFENNYKGATENGILVGVYAFSYDLTLDEARKRAKRVIDTLGGRHLDLPVFADMEWDGQNKLKKEEVTEICRTFLQTIRDNTGYSTGVYCNKYWYRYRLDMSKLSEHDLWIAAPDIKTPVLPNICVWQNDWHARVDGIDGDVDTDLFVKDYSVKEGPKVEAGWKNLNGQWAWLQNDGNYAKDRWIKYKNHWYYLKDDMFIAKGPYKVKDELFYFNEEAGSLEGAMMRTNDRGALEVVEEMED